MSARSLVVAMVMAIRDEGEVEQGQHEVSVSSGSGEAVGQSKEGFGKRAGCGPAGRKQSCAL